MVISTVMIMSPELLPQQERSWKHCKMLSSPRSKSSRSSLLRVCVACEMWHQCSVLVLVSCWWMSNAQKVAETRGITAAAIGRATERDNKAGEEVAGDSTADTGAKGVTKALKEAKGIQGVAEGVIKGVTEKGKRARARKRARSERVPLLVLLLESACAVACLNGHRQYHAARARCPLDSMMLCKGVQCLQHVCFGSQHSGNHLSVRQHWSRMSKHCRARQRRQNDSWRG